MDSNKSIINIGDVTKPVTQLLDCIAKSIGVLYEPTRIIKKAKAEANALIIKKEAELIESSIATRALNKMQIDAIKKQMNIESIIDKTLPLIEDANDSENNISDDWLNEFFKFAQEISDEEIQMLWAKILANQYNGTMNYSFRSLDILRQLDQKMAIIFEKFAAASIENQTDISFIVNYNTPEEELCISFLEMANLTITEIEDLICNGFVVKTFFHRLLTNLELEYEYDKKFVKLKLASRYFLEHLEHFEIYRLTREGKELASLTKAPKNYKYISFTSDIIKGCGLFFAPTGKSEVKNKDYYSSDLDWGEYFQWTKGE